MYRLLFLCLIFLSFQSMEANLAQTRKNCRLEVIDQQRIMHLKGSPYEIGYQHGSLLKSEISENLTRFIESMLSYNRIQPPVITHFMEALPQIIPHIPNELLDEMQGIADATGQPFTNILLLNLFPEMFHCTGIIVNDSATASGELYHVRVLDYSQGNGLQNTAVLAVVKPEHGIPFLNITYAGFVGCVTGMNHEKIAIGEIGGKGYGHWNGVPMAFLLRTILQHASTLEDIKHILTRTPRTCEYYYLFSDGKTRDSFACYATPDVLKFIKAGETYYKCPPVRNTFDPPHSSPNYDAMFLKDTFYQQPKDVLMISRWDHYDLLKERLLVNYGNIDFEDLKEVIKQPIAHKANLHNAIFAPETLGLWISHAGATNEPACDEPYHYFNLNSLLGRKWQSP